MGAPLINELPMPIERELTSHGPKSCRLVGQIVNVYAAESVLCKSSKVDVKKLHPITYAPINHHYLVLGKRSSRPSMSV